MKESAIEKRLEQLTSAVEKLVANPVAPVLPVAPIAPIAPVLPIEPISAVNSGDHDLLLSMKSEFGTKLDRVISDVAKLNDNYSNRIDALERGKISRVEYEKNETDHENRIRTTEKFQENLMGKLSILTAAISTVIALVISWLSRKFGL